MGKGFKLYSLKAEGGVLYLTSKSACVPCDNEDWTAGLSKVKCDQKASITSKDLLKLESQSHVSAQLHVKVM